MRYSDDIIFAAGMAAPSASTPIAVQYDLLLVTFLFSKRSGIILDAEANMVCSITSEYVKSLLVGKCIYTDLDLIQEEIKETYLGISRQALQVCMKDAFNKIQERGIELPILHNVRSVGKEVIDKSVIGGYNLDSSEQMSRGASVMKQLPESAICVVGLSKTNSRNPITKVHQSLIVSMIVNSDTGEILAAEFNTICKLTSDFIADMVIGKNIVSDLPEMLEQIHNRYLGDSRKAIATILKDAHNKFINYNILKDAKASETT